MKRLLMSSVALSGLLFLALGCAEAPEKAQMREAIEELRMMRQEMARMGSTESAEYEIRVALMAFYSYLLKKEAQIPYHIPMAEIVNDTDRIRMYSYWTPETYIRDVHYSGDRFDYIEIKDLKIMAYDTDARASYKVVPYKRITKNAGSDARSTLRPFLIDNKPFELYPPNSPVRLKKLPMEEGEELMWKVNYRDALITGFQVPKEKEPGLFAKVAGWFGGEEEPYALDDELWEDEKKK